MNAVVYCSFDYYRVVRIRIRPFPVCEIGADHLHHKGIELPALMRSIPHPHTLTPATYLEHGVRRVEKLPLALNITLEHKLRMLAPKFPIRFATRVQLQPCKVKTFEIKIEVRGT